MTKWNRKEIQDRAVSELEQAASAGIRYMELANRIYSAAPETPFNTIVGSLHDLSLKNPDIVRPSRGLWILKKYSDKLTNESWDQQAVEAETEIEQIQEKDFYEAFAEWLVGEEQVIEAMVVGGNLFKNKWATPDVIGTYKSKKSDPVQFPIELVSAELKTDGEQSIVAFGQACAYRLFSHKTFIAMPSSIKNTDLDRLDALCSLYGMGLVLFDLNVKTPNFRMVLKPQRVEPDMFYLNDFARRLLDQKREHFDRLF